MTNSPTPPGAVAPARPPRPPSRWSSVRSAAQLMLSLALAGGVLAYLLLPPTTAPTVLEQTPGPAPAPAVEVTGPNRIRIRSGTPLAKKLQVAPAQSSQITAPVMTVAGTTVACLRPGQGKGNDFWQFSSPEVLTAYTDWQKATADITFTRGQLERVKELAETRVKSQQEVVNRLKKLVAAGTDTPKDLAQETTNLLQYQIQGKKEVYEAETAVQVARRNEAALARQLQQAGLEPEMLRSATSDMDIVMADVPEAALVRVKVGQECQARFFGLPRQTFTGKIDSIAPVLSRERRTLRALLVLHDPKDQLRPGMFAEIGLGTDAREALLIPTDGVLHVGRADYVLVGDDEADAWRVAEVQVGEPRGDEVEVLEGVKAGERVVGHGAILLKPAVVRALQAPEASTSGPRAEGPR